MNDSDDLSPPHPVPMVGPPRPVSMVELEDVVGMEDDDVFLLRSQDVEKDSFCFSCCVFPCSDVAISATRLKMTNQGLTQMPIELFSAVLVEVDLSRNSLTAVPSAFSRLLALRKLNLSHNQLSQVDEGLFALTDLRHLDLSYNRLPFLSRDVLQLADLEYLNLTHNPMAWPPTSLSAHALKVEFCLFLLFFYGDICCKRAGLVNTMLRRRIASTWEATRIWTLRITRCIILVPETKTKIDTRWWLHCTQTHHQRLLFVF
jgi:hypothetical protein